MADESNIPESYGEDLDSTMDAVARLSGLTGTDEPYYERIELRRPPFRLIQVDAVIMASYLLTARIAFRSFPGVLSRALSTLERQIGGFLGGQFVSWTLTTVVSYVLTVIRTIAETLITNRESRAIELRIREAAHSIREEIIVEALAQGQTRERKTLSVSSRHGR